MLELVSLLPRERGGCAKNSEKLRGRGSRYVFGLSEAGGERDKSAC